MRNRLSTDELRTELARRRGALAQHADEMVGDARRLVDWRYHFRAHPWFFCGVAATVGFLAVPRSHGEESLEPGLESEKEAIVAPGDSHAGGGAKRAWAQAAARAIGGVVTSAIIRGAVFGLANFGLEIIERSWAGIRAEQVENDPYAANASTI